MKLTTITPKFVDFIPEQLNEGIFYISEKYGTIVHKCCCGCGQEVVTPISPVEWQLRKDGATITLRPSIGNWNYPCQSHYLISRNKVEWAGRMSMQQIQWVQERDRKDKELYYSKMNAKKTVKTTHVVNQAITESWLSNLWITLKKCWNR